MNYNRIVFLPIFAFSILLISGCGVFGSRPFAPDFARYSGALDWTEITSELDARHPPDRIESLRSKWKITMIEPDGGGKTAFRANVLMQSPDQLRFRAVKMATVVAEFFVNGSIVTIHDQMDNKIYRGQLSDLQDRDWLLGWLNPAGLSELLLVQQHLLDGLRDGRFRSANGRDMNEERGRLLLIAGREGRLVEALSVRTDTLLVERAGLYVQDGARLKRLPVEVHYSQYDVYDDYLLPRRLTILDTQTDGSIILEALSYEVNSKLHPRSFEAPSEETAPVFPLSTLWDQNVSNAP